MNLNDFVVFTGRKATSFQHYTIKTVYKVKQSKLQEVFLQNYPFDLS